MGKRFTCASTTPPWHGCWPLEIWRDRQPDGSSVCRSTITHPSTVRVSDTLARTPSPDAHAPRGALTSKSWSNGQTTKGYVWFLLHLLMAATIKTWDGTAGGQRLGAPNMEIKAGRRPEWRDISNRGPVYKRYWAQWKSFALRDGVLVSQWESADGRKKTT